MNLSVRNCTVVLFVSLALNLFLAGMLGAGWVKRDGAHSTGREPGPSEMLFHAREALGQGQHPRLRSVLDARRPALVEHRRAMRAARDEVRQSLESEPFDPERLSQALAALRRETTSSQAVLHESLVELARGMNVEQRRRLAGLAIEDKGRSRRGPR
jgi:uncharacterized membrane protein